MEESLLLFTPECPSWDEETFRIAGEDPSVLAQLWHLGLLTLRDQAYVLTQEGEYRRQKAAQETGCPAFPIGSFDPETALWRNKLHLLLDRAILGRWGVKEFTIGETFPVVPDLKGPDLYRTDRHGQVRYTWPEHPLIQSLLEHFPNCGVSSRGIPAPGDAGLDSWAKLHKVPRGSFTWDLTLRSRYDFALYRQFPPLETDRFRCQNADRIFCLRCRDADPQPVYDALGKLHLFILALRRIYIPGYADFDSQDQENQNILTIVTDREETLLKLAKKLQNQGKALIDPAKPLFLIGTSLERLRLQESPSETACDWFAEQTLHILRPDTE